MRPGRALTPAAGIVLNGCMPDTILVEIAAALAAKVADSLYDLVRAKFKGRKQALAVLEAADGAAPDSPQVIALAHELELAESGDQQFARKLRSEWSAFNGGVINQISGTVTGNVIQARDIHGDITLG
jgi:hypothetical protein